MSRTSSLERRSRVLSTDPSSGKVDVSPKKNMVSNTENLDGISFSDLHGGDIVDGQVKKVESFELLVTIQSSKMVGLCHVSELSDEPILDIYSCHKLGDLVKAKILKVSLDDSEGSDQEDCNKGHENGHVTEVNTKKSEKRLKEEETKVIRNQCRRKRALQKDVPQTLDEFEKLDAVKKIFQRFLQYCDCQKVHLALLAMYESTEQYQLADELLDRMTKRFKTSCKFLFAKYLKYEKPQADRERETYVKQKAMECADFRLHSCHKAFLELEFLYPALLVATSGCWNLPLPGVNAHAWPRS